MDNYIGKVCPFCKTEIKEEDAVKVCPACNIPHHESCWQENRGCTTFGCSEQNSVTTQTQVKCTNCGADIGEGQAFCATCGTPTTVPVANRIKTCNKCGTVIQDNTVFCPTCGNNVSVSATTPAIEAFNAMVTKKKKSKKAISIIAGILVIFAIIGGFVANNIIQEKKAAEEARLLAEAVEEYKDNAYDFYLKVLSSGSTMEDIGNEIQKSWKAYVNSSYYNGKRYYSVDSAVSAAQTYMYSDISSVKSANSSIEALYKELLVIPDTNDQVLVELKNVVKETYEAYKDMYDCVIDPSGNYNSWTSEFGNTDSELADAIGDLRELLN